MAAVKAHGSAQVEADIVGLVATLIDLLGRIVGLEMAVQLVEQGQITGPLAQQPEATGPGPGSESGISGEHDG